MICVLSQAFRIRTSTMFLSPAETKVLSIYKSLSSRQVPERSNIRNPWLAASYWRWTKWTGKKNAKKCLLFVTPSSTIAQRLKSIKFALNGCLPSKSSGSVTGFLTCHLAVKSEDCDRLGQMSSLRKGFKYRPQGCGPGVSVTVGEMLTMWFSMLLSALVFSRGLNRQRCHFEMDLQTWPA